MHVSYYSLFCFFPQVSTILSLRPICYFSPSLILFSLDPYRSHKIPNLCYVQNYHQLLSTLLDRVNLFTSWFKTLQFNIFVCLFKKLRMTSLVHCLLFTSSGKSNYPQVRSSFNVLHIWSMWGAQLVGLLTLDFWLRS